MLGDGEPIAKLPRRVLVPVHQPARVAQELPIDVFEHPRDVRRNEPRQTLDPGRLGGLFPLGQQILDPDRERALVDRGRDVEAIDQLAGAAAAGASPVCAVAASIARPSSASLYERRRPAFGFSAIKLLLRQYANPLANGLWQMGWSAPVRRRKEIGR